MKKPKPDSRVVGSADEQTLAYLRTTEAERDRYRDALVEIDVYLANDPAVWRIVSVCKAGDVLCDVLGADAIRQINASVESLLCPRCLTKSPPRCEAIHPEYGHRCELLATPHTEHENKGLMWRLHQQEGRES